MNDPMDVEIAQTQAQAQAPTPAPASTPPAQEAVPQVPAIAPDVQHAVNMAIAQLVANPQALVSQGHAPTALPWSFDLWYDPPKTQMKLNMTELQTNSLASIMMGDISHRPVKVLFDSGATHNFIASSLVQHLKLQVHANPGSISCGW